jgi:hypothetical protein
LVAVLPFKQEPLRKSKRFSFSLKSAEANFARTGGTLDGHSAGISLNEEI